MPYSPIQTPHDLARRLIPGETREDDWLEFKAEPHERTDQGRAECARDICQFANASGGTLVIGAEEDGHILRSFRAVTNPLQVIKWIEAVIAGQLTPVAPFEAHVLEVQDAMMLAVVNVPPSPVLIARTWDNAQHFEFPVRAGASKRYMTLLEVEARMGNRERMMRLRLEQVSRWDTVLVDADLRNVRPDGWTVSAVDDHTATLSVGALSTDVPLSYVEAVYRTNEPHGRWVVALSCCIQRLEGNPEVLRVRKFRP